ncbi:macro domain-containing protein [Sorangium sp. So ce134]
MPQIIESTGDIFESGCSALVNPVDTTGAQGKGLALAFQRRYPHACGRYKRACQTRRIQPGDVILDDGGEPLILFVATKDHWRSMSRIEWIRRGLDNLVDMLGHELAVPSIAIPALGCGEGGLAWPDVRPLILAAAERMRCERVVVYEPR